MKRRERRIRDRRIRASKEASELQFSSDATIELSAQVEEDGVTKPARFEILAYNGGSLSLPGFEHPVYIDCSRTKIHGKAEQQPILREHNSHKVVGHGRPVIEAGQLRVSDGVFSHDTEASREVIAAAKKGFQWQASVGGRMIGRPKKVQKNQTAQVNGRRVVGPAYILAMMWRETSFCTIGCDNERAHARLAASQKGAIAMDFEKWLEAAGFVADDLDDKQLESLKASFEAQNQLEELQASSDDGGDNGDSGQSTDLATLTDPDIAASEHTKTYLEKVRAARRAEDQRVGELETVAEQYRTEVPRQIHAELFDKAIGGELDRNKFELELIKASRQPQSRSDGNGSAPYRRQKFEQAVIEASMLRSGGMQEDAVTASIRRDYGEDKVEEIMNKSYERPMQGFGLQDLVFASIESAGEMIPSRRMNADVIKCAIRCSQDMILAAGSQTSTVSLPGTLSNIANKQMLQSYEDNTGIWPLICSTTDTSDFKQFDSYRMTEAGVLEPVGPSGEIKHATLGEDPFSNRVVNHAKMIGLTEEMITNDDLGAFQRLSRQFGRMTAHTIEQAVIQTLTGASRVAGTGDATTFFRTEQFTDADSKVVMQPNYLTGAGSALGIVSLGNAWQLFADQTDRFGKPVMLQPEILLTTTGNAILAKNLHNSTNVEITGDTDRTREANNPWHEMFEPIYSSYLSQAAMNQGTAQTTQWYLLARATDDFAAIQVAFLLGQRTPQIDQFEFDPNMLGVSFRAKMPFGVALQDPRCIVRCNGA